MSLISKRSEVSIYKFEPAIYRGIEGTPETHKNRG